jgi:uncharacterized protein
MKVRIEDFSAVKHLPQVIEAGSATTEFATGDKIVFWSPEILKTWSQENGGAMLVAVNQRLEMIGFLLATFHESGIATLENIFVSVDFRGLGVGSILLDEFEGRAATAGMTRIRSFGHVTNEAISKLLVHRGYSEGILTQWYTGKPRAIKLATTKLVEGDFSVRRLQHSDLEELDAYESLGSNTSYAAPCSESVSIVDWLSGSSQITYGAFRNDDPIGFVVVSIHAPTEKATIERVVVSDTHDASQTIESLLLSALRDSAMDKVNSLTAHPLVESGEASGFAAMLTSLEFKERRTFIANTKLTTVQRKPKPIKGRINYKSLFVGSAFFSCGGGVPYGKSIALMSSSSKSYGVELVSVDDFSSDDWLCTVYAIGASGRAQKRYSSFLLAIDHLEKHLGIEIVGVIPGEIGSEINAVWVANEKRIALADTDMVGGRAVPEERMDIYGLKSISSTPAIVVNDQGDVIVIETARDLAILEKVYRAFAVASGGYCYIASRPIKQVDAKSILPCGTVSMAISAGEKLLSSKSETEVIGALQSNFGSRLLARGSIISNAVQDTPGFLSGVMSIRGTSSFAGNRFEVHYKNENIILLRNGEYLCSVPDLISVVDVDTRMPVCNSSLQEGREVLVFGTPALPVWRTPDGISLLGPTQFGFKHEYRPIFG